MKEITKEKLLEFVPRSHRDKVTDEFMKLFNNMGADTDIYQDYMVESFLQHIPVLNELKNIELKDYIDAIKYCNLKRKMSNEKAWRIVFRDRVDELIANGRENQISQNVHYYNSRKIVQKIDADMSVALYIQYAPMKHAAIQKAYDLMNGKASPSLVPVYKKRKGKFVLDSHGRKIIKKDKNGNPIMEEVYMTVTPKIQLEAISKILDITMIPEDKKQILEIGLTDNAIESQKEIADRLAEIAKAQREALIAGKSINDVQKIGHELAIDVDIEDDDDDE